MNIININDTSNKLFFVGGVVRDEILGIESFDVDMVYEGNAIEFVNDEVIHQDATLSTGHDSKSDLSQNDKFVIQINKPFGTVRVKIDGREVDIASTRQEVYEKKGHLPTVTKIGCSLKEDSLRRDFTINALYKSVSTGEIIDPTGGLEDLKNKKIKVLHNKSFIDDPTRILRALKFSIRFGFELDEHTKKLQDEYLNNINYDMCYKRIKKELIETFNLNSQKAFEKFINDRIYKLVTTREITLPNVNIEKVINEILSPGAILHENKFSAKEGKQVQDDKKISLPEIKHLWLIYVGILGDLSCLPLTKNEQKIIDDFNSSGEPQNDFEIYKTFEKFSIETILLYAILKNKDIAEKYLDKLRHIKLQINGDDLVQLGLKPSKKFSEIFDYVLRKKIENPTLTKKDEIELAKQILL